MVELFFAPLAKKQTNKQKTHRLIHRARCNSNPQGKIKLGGKKFECQTTFVTMYQEPSISPTPLILGHTTHMQSAENPDLKVLGRPSLVIE